MWKLKNNDEYVVFASSRNQAVKKFKNNLGIKVPKYMIEEIL